MGIKLQDSNLLIVDDDDSLRSTLCDFFSEEGANVFSASNGEEALQITLVENIDLILSDIKMPVMDGVELLKSINDSRHVPLVWLMSGESNMKEAGAIELGAQGLLSKPFTLLTVLDKVTASLESK